MVDEAATAVDMAEVDLEPTTISQQPAKKIWLFRLTFSDANANSECYILAIVHRLLDEQKVTFKLNSLMDNVHLLTFYFCNSDVYLIVIVFMDHITD